MFDIIKDSFRLTNKYIILATPLILFSLISSLYIIFSATGSSISLLFALILFILMLAAFLSGWLFMVKKCVSNPEYDDINALISEFPAGVGEYFLPVIAMIVIIAIISSCLMSAAYLFGVHFIGDIKDLYQGIMSASATTGSLKTYIEGLPVKDLIKLNNWNLLLFFSSLITYFLIMFYSPAVFFTEKNPLKALLLSVKQLFSKKFFKNILLFLSVFGIYMAISLISVIASANIFIHFILTLINFYYIVFATVYIYNFYYKNYAN